MVCCLQPVRNAQHAADGESFQDQRDWHDVLVEVCSDVILTICQKLRHVEAHCSVHNAHEALWGMILHSMMPSYIM